MTHPATKAKQAINQLKSELIAELSKSCRWEDKNPDKETQQYRECWQRQIDQQPGEDAIYL